MRRGLAITAITVALVLGSSACGDDTSDSGGSPSGTEDTGSGSGPTDDGPEVEGASLDGKEFESLVGEAAVEVGVYDNSYRAPYIEVSPGTVVTFANGGRTEHNVLPVVEDAFEPIEIEQLAPGKSAALTFDEPGDYAYYCSLHGTATKGMVGGVRVAAE